MGQTFQMRGPATMPAVNGSRRHHAAVESYETELDDMRARVARFVDEDPADVLATISGIAGRLAEIRAHLYRDNSQRCSQLRTREVDPLRDDLDLQFRLISRRIALMEWELKLSGGGV